LPNEDVTATSDLNLVVHHPKFGIALKEQMDKLGIDCVVEYKGQPDGKKVSTIEFFKKHFERALKK
jgi:hypothetical protein